MKKTLLITALLTAGATQVQAASYNKYFYVSNPAKGEVTITFSGFCSGKIVDTVSSVNAGASDNQIYQTSYAGVRASMLKMQTGNYFYGESAGSISSITIKKGMLNIALKDSSRYGLDQNFEQVHNLGADSVVTCKNGQTLNAMLNNIGWNSNIVNDNTQTNNAFFTLKGSAEPFDFKYAQTVSGYLDFPAACKNTGAFTDNIATDTYQSTCKMVNRIKVKIVATASGTINYD